MENPRIILLVALAFVCFALWNAWNKDYAHEPARVVQTNTSQTSITSQAARPQVPVGVADKVTESVATSMVPTKKQTGFISVKTDVLNVQIDPQGGNIVGLTLPQYPEALHRADLPFTLMSDHTSDFYVAESALVGPFGPDKSNAQAQYTSAESQYVLESNQKTLNVVLQWEDPQGVSIEKIYTFNQGDYLVHLKYVITNHSKEAWTGNLYTQLSRTEPVNQNKGWFQIHPFVGAAVSSPEKRYQEIAFSKLTTHPVDKEIRSGWVAMVQHYFLGAWIPDPNENYHYYSNVSDNKIYTVGMMGPNISVQPGESYTISSRLYTGPEITDNLRQIAPGLNLTVSYGWLWPISSAIFWLMKKINDVIGNWGWSIIAVTLLIKLAFYHLSAKSYRSMAMMRKLQPKIEAIKERYGEDRQKLSQAMMELYKKEKINPLGGCLPILVQIPVFFALYMVLIESVELRQAPWLGWIHDLATPDPLYILPVIMGITMFIQQKLNPPPADPMQARIMMFLPVVFTVLFIGFPSGLVLYWVVNNTLSILQQWYVMRSVDDGNGNAAGDRVVKKVNA
ncbi:MAG: membrane protein insertase YidC [Gammaproteobacteria bacterium]